jgi:hypothetical protein
MLSSPRACPDLHCFVHRRRWPPPSVNVQADTLYEAVVLAVRAFREHDCGPPTGEPVGSRSAEPERHAHGEHEEGAEVGERRGEEPEREAREGATEGTAGLVKRDVSCKPDNNSPDPLCV